MCTLVFSIFFHHMKSLDIFSGQAHNSQHLTEHKLGLVTGSLLLWTYQVVLNWVWLEAVLWRNSFTSSQSQSHRALWVQASHRSSSLQIASKKFWRSMTSKRGCLYPSHFLKKSNTEALRESKPKLNIQGDLCDPLQGASSNCASSLALTQEGTDLITEARGGIEEGMRHKRTPKSQKDGRTMQES